jgi:hypothetical protein
MSELNIRVGDMEETVHQHVDKVTSTQMSFLAVFSVEFVL